MSPLRSSMSAAHSHGSRWRRFTSNTTGSMRDSEAS